MWSEQGWSICSVQAAVESEAMAGNLAALRADISLPCLGDTAVCMILTSGVWLPTALHLVPVVLQPANWAHRTLRLGHPIWLSQVNCQGGCLPVYSPFSFEFPSMGTGPDLIDFLPFLPDYVSLPYSLGGTGVLLPGSS